MSDEIQDSTKSALRVGTKVRIQGFPRASDPFNQFDYNGLLGEIIGSQKVGLGLNEQPVYTYDVYFKNVTVPFITRRPDGKLDRKTKVTDARNTFEESYIVRVD